MATRAIVPPEGELAITFIDPLPDAFNAESLDVDGANVVISITKEHTLLKCSTDHNGTIANGGANVIRKTIRFLSQGSTQVNILGSTFKKGAGQFAYNKLEAVLTDGDVQVKLVWLPDESAWIVDSFVANPTSMGVFGMDVV